MEFFKFLAEIIYQFYLSIFTELKFKNKFL